MVFIPNSKQIIDIDRYLKVQPGSAFYGPKKALASLVKRYIHEPELNQLLVANQERQGVEWARGMLETLNIAVETVGEENLKKPGQYVLVGNHPLGGFDGLAVLAIAGKYHPGIMSLSHNMLRMIPNTQSIIVPINTKALNSREVVADIDQLYRSEHQVLIFPAGVVSRRQKGIICDLPWAKTFLTKAVAFRREIIPIHVAAQNSAGFYRFSKIRRLTQKVTGLRLEIFSLVRESLRQRNRVIRLTFGQPVSWETFDASRSFTAWAQELRRYVYYLKEHPESSFIQYLATTEARQ